MAEELVEPFKRTITLCFDVYYYAIRGYRLDWEFADEDSAVDGAVEANFATGRESERVRGGFG